MHKNVLFLHACPKRRIRSQCSSWHVAVMVIIDKTYLWGDIVINLWQVARLIWQVIHTLRLKSGGFFFPKMLNRIWIKSKHRTTTPSIFFHSNDFFNKIRLQDVVKINIKKCRVILVWILVSLPNFRFVLISKAMSRQWDLVAVLD